jgi:hypothetical protein
LKNVWVRTCVAGSYNTSGGSTNLGASDDMDINISTLGVCDVRAVSMLKVRTNVAAVWEM